MLSLSLSLSLSHYRYYLLNIIVPIFLLVVLSMVCYIMPATSLDARLALSITLFLSLTALQLVVNDQVSPSRLQIMRLNF